MANVVSSKKLAIVAGIVGAIALSSPAMAKRGGDKGGSFERLDADASGSLTIDELTIKVPEKAEKVLANKDADLDGVVSFDEYNTDRDGNARTDLSLIADDIVLCVADVQAETGDDNIVVPSADVFLSPSDKFNNIDTSGDTFLDLAEIEASLLAKAQNKFNNMDSNSDSLVSADEYSAGKATSRATKKAIRECVAELTAEESL